MNKDKVKIHVQLQLKDKLQTETCVSLKDQIKAETLLKMGIRGVLPTFLSQLKDDPLHRTVTDEQILEWDDADLGDQSDWTEDNSEEKSYIKHKPYVYENLNSNSVDYESIRIGKPTAQSKKLFLFDQLFYENGKISNDVLEGNLAYLDKDQIFTGQNKFEDDLYIGTDIYNKRNLYIYGDIYQEGSIYVTHAENLFIKDSFMFLRDGALAALKDGEFTGLIAKNYDGSNDGALMFDKNGIARVGDINYDYSLINPIPQTRDEYDGYYLRTGMSPNFTYTEIGPSTANIVPGTTDCFRMTLNGNNTVALAAREDNPINGGFAQWDESSLIFKTVDLTPTFEDIQNSLNNRVDKPTTNATQFRLATVYPNQNVVNYLYPDTSIPTAVTNISLLGRNSSSSSNPIVYYDTVNIATSSTHSITRFVNGELGSQVNPSTDDMFTRRGWTLDRLFEKVDKEENKGLSHNDLTGELKNHYDEAYEKSHIHTNKDILDIITAPYTTEEQLKVSKIVVDGDGKKALMNDGTYKEAGKVDTVNGIIPDEFKNVIIKTDDISDTDQTNKFVTDTEKEGWNAKEPPLPARPEVNEESKFLGWDGTGNKVWKEVSGTGGGGGLSTANIYLTELASTTEGTYKQLSYDLEGTTTVRTKTVNNNTKLLDTYLFDPPIATTRLDSGTWNLNVWCRVSVAGGATRLTTEIFKRALDGTQTILFTTNSVDINNTTYEYVEVHSEQPSFDVLETDRIGFNLYIGTTCTSSVIFDYHIGDGKGAYLNIPLALRHIQLRDLNGDTNYLHTTSAEKVSWNNKAGKADNNIFTGENIFANDVKIGTVEADVDLNIKGTLNIDGDIFQKGSSYETHAEQVYTTSDEIILRDGAEVGLAVGEEAGLKFKKYDGTNDGVLKIDKDGIVRVGDVGSEQPLATREDSPLFNGIAQWDAANYRFKTINQNTLSIPFSNITSKPTTLSGYGITPESSTGTSTTLVMSQKAVTDAIQTAISNTLIDPNKTYMVIKTPADFDEFTLLTGSTGAPNYTIEWGDGSSENVVDTSNPTHIYEKAGMYLITISSSFTNGIAVGFNTNVNKDKMIEVYGGTNYPTNIGSYAFTSCINLTTATFPNATSMGDNAFYECSSLTTANFPRATSMGNSAFTSCINLTTANFPNATSIGGFAFSYCSNLTTATFPNATSIGDFAFYKCSSLKTLTLGNVTTTNMGTRFTNVKLDNLTISGTITDTDIVRIKNLIISNGGSFSQSYEIKYGLQVEKTPTLDNDVVNKIYLDTNIVNSLNNKVDKVPSYGLSKNDYDDTEKAAVASNTEARHSHSNKALLDTYMQTETNLADAVSKKHSHSNKALLDMYSQTEVDLADAVSKKHEHSNKTILDATTASFTTAKDTKLTGIETGAQVNTVTSVAGRTGAVTVTKTDVGLGNVDNTSDANKPVSSAQATALDLKVDKVADKALSTNDLTNTLKSNYDTAYANNHTHSNKTVLDNTTASYTTGEQTKLSGIAIGAEVNVQSDWNAISGDALILNKPTTISGYGITDALNSSLKGANNGLAELDATGKVPSGQLPSYVDDVIEVANYASLPTTGEDGKIYITLDTNLTYRWSGSGYVEISPSLALGETSSTAYRGDSGKTAYDHSQLTSGNPHNVTKSNVGLSNVDNTSDANKPISNAAQAALDTKQDELVSGVSIKTINNTSLLGSGDITISGGAGPYLKDLDKTYLVVRIPTNSDVFTLSTGTSGSPNYTIEWGDGSSEDIVDTSYPTHTYLKAGMYLITISGDFANGIVFGSSTNVNKDKMIEVYGGTNYPTSIGTYAFQNCKNLTTANIPNATSLGDYAFNYCKNLTTTTFPKVTTIGIFAFRGCTNLTTANFPNATSISGEAFSSCTSLTIATIPNATSLGGNAFYNCTSLKTLTLGNVTTTGSGGRFTNVKLDTLTISGNITEADITRIKTFFTNNGGSFSQSYEIKYGLQVEKTPTLDNDVVRKIDLDTLDKADIGLGNVDNTSDANKPISTLQQAALDAKANNTELRKKAVQPYIQRAYSGGNGPRLVGTYNYSTSVGDTRPLFYMVAKQGHGNGNSYLFWGEYIFGVSTTGAVTAKSILKVSDGTFGKLYYRHDTTNKILYIYIYTGQYSSAYFSDLIQINAGDYSSYFTLVSAGSVTSDTVVEGVNVLYPASGGTIALTSQLPNVQQTTETTNAGTGTVSQTLSPNIYYKFTGAPTTLTLTLGTATSGKMNEYMFQFVANASGTTLTAISGVTWVGGTPTITASKTYQASIVNGIGVIMEA